MDLYSEFFDITSKLNNAGIKYSVVGGIALAFHDVPRFTRDIDILVLPEDVPRISVILKDSGYSESADPWTFKRVNLTLHRFAKIKGEEHIMIDILAGGDDRHKKIIEQSVSASSGKGNINIAAREDLIWMKRIRNSDQDKVDIKNLKDDKD